MSHIWKKSGKYARLKNWAKKCGKYGEEKLSDKNDPTLESGIEDSEKRAQDVSFG